MIHNIAIGFVTGRKTFKNTLKTYTSAWWEHGLYQDPEIKLHLFIAYDLKYQQTQVSDFKNIPQEWLNRLGGIHFIGEKEITEEVNFLKQKEVLLEEEALLLFGDGYAGKRNIVTYFAIKNKMDKIVFIDDDEYPLAVYKDENDTLTWVGQQIVKTHMQVNGHAHVTHGHHCGYISPIPYVSFNQALTEDIFRNYIEAISNELVSWESMRDHLLHNKGVTYAQPQILQNQPRYEVEEKHGMKFISGANLCLHLKEYHNLPPFYNPKGARGEDTFMSTALSKLRVVKVPCYTFHDGFARYTRILNGVLPTKLLPIEGNTPPIVRRFVQASIGWIRYKPLLVYITNRKNFVEVAAEVEEKLQASVPTLCAYFKTEEFKKLLKEWGNYKKKVSFHFEEFEKTKMAWKKLLETVPGRL